MASQEEKTVEGLLREGKIINSYGKYTLVTVSPVEDIDKIKFSIVKLNTGGKEHADFYLGTRDFIELCNEIDCGKFMLDVKTSLQNNSNIKEYVSGVNGSKNMTFRTGNKGIMVKIGNNKNGQWNNLHGILAYKDFVWMSFIFKIIYGFSPVQEGTMMDRWQKAFINRPKFQPQQSASNQYQQPNNVSMPNQYQQFAVPNQYQIPAGY